MSSSNQDDSSSKGGAEPGSGSKRPFWDELLFGAIEKIAQAPSKLKDPKESILAASEWVKGVREDIQKKMASEISERLSQLDWDSLSKRVAEDLAERFEINVETKIRFKKKRPSKENDSE